MSTVEKSIRLYAWKPNYQTFTIVQGESKSRIFNIQLFDSSTPLDLRNTNVNFYVKKPDGKNVYINCSIINALQGQISVTLTEQVATVEGSAECWIQVIGITTTDLRFEGMELKVSPCALTQSLKDSADDMQAFLQNAARLGVAETDIDNIQKEIADARDGEDLKATFQKHTDRENQLDARIDNIFTESGSTIKFLKVTSPIIPTNSTSNGISYTFTSDNNEELSAVKDKNPQVIEVGAIMFTGAEMASYPISSTYLDMSTTKKIDVRITPDQTISAGQLKLQFVMTISYDEEVLDPASAELTDLRVGYDGVTDTSAGAAVRRQFNKIQESVTTLKNDLDNLDVETDSTLTQENKPADAKATGAKFDSILKYIEDYNNRNNSSLISKQSYKELEDSEEIYDENRLYSFNKSFAPNLIDSENNKYLLSIDDNGQFSANLLKETGNKILISTFKIKAGPQENNSFYVSLAEQPESDVELSIRASSLCTLSTNKLVFTQQNYFVPQSVTVSADSSVEDIILLETGKQNAEIEFIVNGGIRYIFQNGEYVNGVTSDTVVGYGGSYSISDNLIILGGTIELKLSGVNLKNGDSIILRCIESNNSTAHYTCWKVNGVAQNMGNYSADKIYTEIQANGFAEIKYTNNTGATLTDISIQNSFTKFKGNEIRIVEVEK